MGVVGYCYTGLWYRYTVVVQKGWKPLL